MARFIDQQFFQELIEKAKSAERKRSHFNFHADLSDAVHRLCIALTPGTYVRPHFHPQPKSETFITVYGEIMLMLFDSDGVVTDKTLMSPQGEVAGVEIPPYTIHTMYPVNGNAVFFETKQGPYVPPTPEEFAAWAPAEGDSTVVDCLAWFDRAQPGDRYSAN